MVEKSFHILFLHQLRIEDATFVLKAAQNRIVAGYFWVNYLEA